MIWKSKAGEGHHHLFFVPEGENQGISTENDGHTHVILIEGETAIALGGGREGEDPHIHDLSKVRNVPPPKIPEEDDEEIVSDVYHLFKAAHQENLECFEDGEESEAFYMGQHWEEHHKKELEQAGRACLSINEVGAQIDTLLGYQKNNRSDYAFRPIEESDARVGHILNEVVKNICEQNDFIYEESNVAEDQYIVGRGNFVCYMDYDEDIEGKIRIEKLPWRDVIYGPYQKLDRSDCEYLIKQKMFSLARLKRMFPDKADEIQKDYHVWQKVVEKQTVSGKEYSLETGTLTIAGTQIPKLDVQAKEYRFIELWQKQFRTEYILVDVVTGEVENVTGVDKKVRASMEGEDRFKVVPRTVYDIRVSKVAGNTLLSDEIVEMPDNDFDVIPVHAKYKNGKWWGKVEDLKDVQREINHRTSQVVDIINKTISYNWFYDEETFANPSEEEDFKDNSTSPGHMAKLNNIERPPVQVQGSKTPVEVIELERIATEKLYRISNVPMETQGDSKMQLSGAAIREKTQVALQGNRYLFDNMNLAKRLLARKIVALIQEHYTPERILRLIRKQGEPGEMAADPQMAEIQKMEDAEIITLLETTDLMKYDIQVDSSPYSPTIRMANQMLLQELMKQGIPIPMEYFLAESDLPNKDKFMAQYTKQQQAAQQAEADKNETEVKKAMIAAQSRQQGGGPQG